MNTDDVLAALPRAKPAHHHRWNVPPPPAAMEDGDWRMGCRCGALKDVNKSKRGRTARQRGNAYERDVAARLGAKRVGQYGTSVDVGGGSDWIAAQVKVGGAFSERYWAWLDAIPRDAMHIRAVVVGDAPGAGRKRREIIVLELEDFVRWFGK